MGWVSVSPVGSGWVHDKGPVNNSDAASDNTDIIHCILYTLYTVYMQLSVVWSKTSLYMHSRFNGIHP